MSKCNWILLYVLISNISHALIDTVVFIKWCHQLYTGVCVLVKDNLGDIKITCIMGDRENVTILQTRFIGATWVRSWAARQGNSEVNNLGKEAIRVESYLYNGGVEFCCGSQVFPSRGLQTQQVYQSISRGSETKIGIQNCNDATVASVWRTVRYLLG